MTTHLPPSPGWYPDPSGSSAQKYWDGQGWQNADPQPALSRDDIRAAMAENRSIWATNAMAAYSLIIGCVSLLLLLMCGVGGATAVPGGIVGFIAFNKSKQTGAGRGMAIAGLATNGAAFVIGCIVGLVMLFAMGSLGH